MAIKRGFGAVQESIARAAENDGKFNSTGLTHPIQKLWNIGWKGGEERAVRFITDALVSVKFYDYVATLNGKHGEFVDTSEIEGPEKREDWIKANLTDPKTKKPLRPTEKTIAIVVERELVDGEWQDIYDEFEEAVNPDDPNSEETQTVEWPRFWVLKQGRRFWSQLDPYYVDYSTLSDRTYRIKRGADTSPSGTSYTVREVKQVDGEPITTEDYVEAYGIPPVKDSDERFTVENGYDAETVEAIKENPIYGYLLDWVERRATVKWFEKLTGSKEEDKPEVKRGSLGSRRPGLKTPAKPAEEPQDAPEADSADEPKKKPLSLKEKLRAHNQ